MNDRKIKLLETLDAFVNQRPGLDPNNYGWGMDGWRSYRRESAAITRDMHDYYAIRGQIAWRDSITADDIIKASKSAFSGRLEITETTTTTGGGSDMRTGRREPINHESTFKLSYCAGQYMPTEYRKAACAVLASAWWDATRADCPDFETDDKGEFVGSNPGAWMQEQAKRTFARGVRLGYFR